MAAEARGSKLQSAGRPRAVCGRGRGANDGLTLITDSGGRWRGVFFFF